MPKLYLISSLILFLSIALVPGPVIANTDFDTSSLATYTIDAQGKTRVQQSLKITNKTSSAFVNQFDLAINASEISQVSIVDASGKSVPFTVNNTTAGTILSIQFNQAVIGKEKSQVATIQYAATEYATKTGSILEINIPQVPDLTSFSAYAITLIIPKDFGQPQTIEPTTPDSSITQQFTRITFQKPQLLQSGIRAVFGNQQHYQLSLKFPLTNTSITPIETQVALPPDTVYQQVIVESMDPEPQKLETDADGNWIATYRVEPKQQLIASANLGVNVYNKPTLDMPVTQNLNRYTQSQTFWETDAPKVQEVSQKLSNPKQIYDYVSQTLKYDYSRADNISTNRFGAQKALQDPTKALCLEFSDTFIALARAKKIPARLNTGYAVSNNESLRPVGLVQNVLHAWPEYYDSSSQQFIAIDPTWTHTTGGIDYFHSFDFNHITFAIHGLDSARPFPAGYFQSGDTQAIKVSIADQPLEATQGMKSNMHYPIKYLLGLSKSADLIVTNTGNSAIHQMPVELKSEDQVIAKTNINYLIPMETKVYPVQLSQIPANSYVTTSQTSYPVNSPWISPNILGLAVFLATLTIATAIIAIIFRSRGILFSQK